MALNSVQQILSRYTAYDRAEPRVFGAELNSTLIVEDSYKARNNLNSSQIALDFYSDQSVWSYVGLAAVGDLGPQNLGTDKDKTSYSKVKRFQSRTAETTHKLRCSADATYPNGFFPDILYIGNHNLDENDTIHFKAYNDAAFTSLAYSQQMLWSQFETFCINTRQFAKYKFYEIEFTLEEARVLKIGRMILAGSLPTFPENNAQKGITGGWTDHKDEMMTEAKTRLFNRQYWAKKLNFAIQTSLSQVKLSSQIERLIMEGTGSRPFLVVLNPKDPGYLSLYGILTTESEFEHKQRAYGLYTFDVEEFQ